MTTRLEVIAAIDSYAAGVGKYAREQQKAADQVIIDDLNNQIAALENRIVTLNGTIAVLNTENDELQALVADLEATIDQLEARIAELEEQLNPHELIEFSNFVTHASGKYIGPVSYVGKGMDKTTLQMKPMTSNKAAEVNALVAHQTNLYKLVRIGGLSASQSTNNLECAGFYLRGTDQGHLYGGLMVGYSVGANIHDIKITGVPGSGSAPPWETFLLATWHADNFRISDVVLDGRDDNEVMVGASLFGTNSCIGGSVTNMKANYSKHAFGAALWDSKDLTFTDCDFRFNRKAINIEGSRGGYYKFVRCDFRGTTGAAYAAQVSSTIASSKVTFEDCIFDNDLCQVRVYPGLANNKQVNSDIRRIVNGVDVTSNTAKFKIVTTG